MPSLDYYSKKALGLWHSGKKQQALDLIDTGLTSQGGDNFCRHMAWTLSSLGEHDRAVMVLTDRFGHEPADVKSITMLVSVYRRSGRLQEAEEAAQRGLNLFADKDGLWRQMGNIYLQKGCYQEALELAQKRLSLTPCDEPLLHVAANAALGLDRIDVFNKAIKSLPDNHIKDYLLAKKFFAQNKPQESLKILARSMSAAFDERACALYLAIVPQSADNPIVRLIRENLRQNTLNFDNIFASAESMRRDRKAFLAFDVYGPASSPVLRDPVYTINSGINSAARRDAGWTRGLDGKVHG